MQRTDLSTILVEKKLLYAPSLRRYVTLDFYLPRNIENPSDLSLLLINDGQDLHKFNFAELLNGLQESGQISPLLCVGIHSGKNRKMEYGTARILDFASRGSKAAAFTEFVLERLIPFIHTQYWIESFRQMGYAGFSLGGLTAIDICWHNPSVFNICGVFSGSLWWRKKDIDKGYEEELDRIMHLQIREGAFVPGLRFYFTTGSLDETADRNNNGIIDSIDDTLGLIEELKKKGYTDDDVRYINFEDGKHDVETWGRAMPAFLLWGWGNGLQ